MQSTRLKNIGKTFDKIIRKLNEKDKNHKTNPKRKLHKPKNFSKYAQLNKDDKINFKFDTYKILGKRSFLE